MRPADGPGACKPAAVATESRSWRWVLTRQQRAGLRPAQHVSLFVFTVRVSAKKLAIQKRARSSPTGGRVDGTVMTGTSKCMHRAAKR